jgi:hypothetical protein
MIPTNTDLVNLCAAIYSDEGPKDWDHLDPGDDDGVYWATRKLGSSIVVVFRGSITAMDWIHDLTATPISTRIGRVHGGFYSGMDQMWSELKPMLDGSPVVITGHSLGASHANMLCGLMIAEGTIPAKRMVVGEPKPGMEDFCSKLCVIPDQKSFVNCAASRHDIVTDVPFSLRPFLPFVRPTALIDVFSTPVGSLYDRDVDPFALHHIGLYQAAVAAYDRSIKQGAAA